MIGKVIGPLVAALLTFFSGFVAIAVMVYFANHGGASGQAAVAELTQTTIGLATAVIRGVVDLGQAVAAAAMGALE